jgi:HSP20 family protein
MRGLIPWRRKDRDVERGDGTWLDRWRNPPIGPGSVFGGRGLPLPPSVDVEEDKDSYTVRAEVPGLTEKDVDVSWRDGVLRIRGEKKSEREGKRGAGYYRECSYGTFTRDIPLGDSADWKAARATCRHGVLTVKLPKTEKARTVIQVKVN